MNKLFAEGKNTEKPIGQSYPMHLKNQRTRLSIGWFATPNKTNPMPTLRKFPILKKAVLAYETIKRLDNYTILEIDLKLADIIRYVHNWPI